MPLIFLPIVRAPACTEIDNIATVKKYCSSMNVIISAQQLHKMLGNNKLLIVDTRPFASYAESHIPGAVNIDLMQFHWIDTSMEGITHFNRQMRILLSNIGVSAEKFVVFYDDISGSSAARGVWLLLYFSHETVAMLDGGFNRWNALNLKTETKTNPFVHKVFRGKTNPRILADTRRIDLKKPGKKIIVDARSAGEYDGSVVRAATAGHIPDAINIDWNANLAQDTFKSIDQLQNLYRKIPKGAEIITYCQGGYRAANTFVVLKMLGYKNVRMYLGSWGEWGNMPGARVSK
jgi:thiosulfate/3-mercaptopyruvate sulfurtransferase